MREAPRQVKYSHNPDIIAEVVPMLFVAIPEKTRV